MIAKRAMIVGAACVVFAVSGGWAMGCKRSAGSSSGSADPSSPVARVVFVDKKEACPCTRGRAAASWSALRDALGEKSSVPVERIYLDRDSKKVATLRKKKAFAVIPALYFLDEAGNVVRLLQGEVEKKSIVTVLGAASRAE